MAVWIAHRPGGPRADRYFVSGTTVTTDAYLPAAINVGLLANGLLAADALAESRADAAALTEYLARLQRHVSASIEPLGNAILEAGTSAEWLSHRISDGLTPAESAANLQNNIMAPLEGLGNARGDAIDPVAFSATQITDSGDPLENLGANSVVGDEFPPLEILAGKQRDALVPGEDNATQRGDANATAEALAGRRAGSSALIEALSRALRDANAPLENLGSAALSADQFVALGFVAGQRIDPQPAPIAWSGAVLFDGRAPVEFTVTAAGGPITSNAFAAIELLVQQTADRNAAAESSGALRGSNILGAEALTRAVRDTPPQIETLGEAAAVADAFLAVEVGYQITTADAFTCEILISSVGASLAAVESWITPIVQLALGRLLKSPGKIRILARWR